MIFVIILSFSGILISIVVFVLFSRGLLRQLGGDPAVIEDID